MCDVNEYSRFELSGHTFIAYGPESDKDKLRWRLEVWREGVLRKTVFIPMQFVPIFGYDVDDVAALNETVERIIDELGLEA